MYSLLLVDDEKLVLLSTYNSVAWKDYYFTDIHTTNFSRHALQILQEHRIDAAFLDIRMPELSAFDIVKYCKDSHIECVFIILTGYSEFKYAQEAIHMGFFDYFVKPLQPEETSVLMNRLGLCVRQNRLQKDPLIFRQLINGDQLTHTLSWMGCNLTRPHFYIVHIYSDNPILALDTFNQIEYAVLLLTSKQIIYFITCIQKASLFLIQYFSDMPAPCGISLYEIKNIEEQLPITLMQASLESESLYMESVRTGKVQLRNNISQKAQLFNPSFLHLMQEVHENFTTDLSLTNLAVKYNLNYTYCSDLFRQLCGTTFSKYITNLRINNAKQLLENTNYPIRIVCDKSGFSDYYYFAKVFKSVTGLTPTDYRNQKASKQT